MKVLGKSKDGRCLHIEISPTEAVILNNALNEVLNGLDISEWHIRLGADEDELRCLLKQFHDLAGRS